MKATSRASNIPLSQSGHPNIFKRNQPYSHSINTCVQMINIITAVENLRSTVLFAIGSWGARLLATPLERTIPEAVSRKQSWLASLIYKRHVVVKQRCTQSRRWGTVNLNSGKTHHDHHHHHPYPPSFSQGPSGYRFCKQQILRNQHKHHKEDCNRALPEVSPSFRCAMLHEASCRKPKQRKAE